MLGGCASGFAQTVGTGHITGRVTDTEGGVLPGVTVTVTGPALREEAITDENGRFDVEGLLQGPPSTYRVTAELTGFSPRTLDNVSADPGRGANVAITLQVGCLQTSLYVDDGLAANLKRADSVFLLRVESSSPPRRWRLGSYCGNATEHVATVIETVKDTPRGTPTTLRFLVEGDHRYDQGTDYMAFLGWEPSIDTYFVLMPGYIVPVRAGSVECGLPNDEMPCGPASDVLTALRSLSAEP